tara:strand:- start:232 stop:420 length:189 start_codon:yes stop_codon:yes gene_type:complete
MNQTYTVIIQSNCIGGEKIAIRVGEKKAFMLRQILAPELKKLSKRESCSSITLENFFDGETN